MIKRYCSECEFFETDMCSVQMKYLSYCEFEKQNAGLSPEEFEKKAYEEFGEVYDVADYTTPESVGCEDFKQCEYDCYRDDIDAAWMARNV